MHGFFMSFIKYTCQYVVIFIYVYVDLPSINKP